MYGFPFSRYRASSLDVSTLVLVLVNASVAAPLGRDGNFCAVVLLPVFDVRFPVRGIAGTAAVLIILVPRF